MSGTEKETTARRIVAARVMTNPGVAGLIKLLIIWVMGEEEKEEMMAVSLQFPV